MFVVRAVTVELLSFPTVKPDPILDSDLIPKISTMKPDTVPRSHRELHSEPLSPAPLIRSSD